MSVLTFLVAFAKMNYFFLLFDFFSKKTICFTHRRGSSIKYVSKICRKSYVSYLWYAHVCTCAYQGVRDVTFFDKFCVRTLSIAPNSVFSDGLMTHLQTVILSIFREESLFDSAANYKTKCVRALISFWSKLSWCLQEKLI